MQDIIGAKPYHRLAESTLLVERLHFDHDEPNESRADYGSRIALCTPDWGQNDIETDIKDALADVAHFVRRVGLDPESLFQDALESAEGDLEDGPEAELDASIAERHNR